MQQSSLSSAGFMSSCRLLMKVASGGWTNFGLLAANVAAAFLSAQSSLYSRPVTLQSSRKELLADIEELKGKITGAKDEVL